MSGDSPYLQRLAHAHILPSPVIPQRPLSAATTTGSSTTGGVGSRVPKPRIDAKFIDNHDLWDPATPRQQFKNARRRPISAPVRPRRWLYLYICVIWEFANFINFQIFLVNFLKFLSNFNWLELNLGNLNTPICSRPLTSQRRAQTTRSLYRYQPLTIVVTAFRNGTRDVFARITAPNMKIVCIVSFVVYFNNICV